MKMLDALIFVADTVSSAQLASQNTSTRHLPARWLNHNHNKLLQTVLPCFWKDPRHTWTMKMTKIKH